MSDQPEALRLADRLESDLIRSQTMVDAAAELRRLSRVEQQRDELLTVLKEALDVCIWPGAMLTDLHERAIAAIAKAEQNT